MWSRISLVFLVAVSIFSFGHYQSWFDLPDSAVSRAGFYLANAVGVSIGVEENSYNRIASQLQERALELDSQEQSLLELERQVIDSIRAEQRTDRIWFLVLSAVTAGLAGLLALNFVFDKKWRSRRQLTQIKV